MRPARLSSRARLLSRAGLSASIALLLLIPGAMACDNKKTSPANGTDEPTAKAATGSADEAAPTAPTGAAPPPVAPPAGKAAVSEPAPAADPAAAADKASAGSDKKFPVDAKGNCCCMSIGDGQFFDLMSPAQCAAPDVRGECWKDLSECDP